MAYDFDNASIQYLTANAPTIGSTLTIACWGYITSTSSNQVFLVLGRTSPNQNRYQLQNNGTLLLFNVNGTNPGLGAAAPGTLSTNTWFHAAGVVASSTDRKGYLNGSSNTDTDESGTISTPTYIGIGARLNDLSQPSTALTGRVAEVGIWNVALADDEIKSLAKGMACDKVRPQSLVFYAPLVRDLIDVRGGLAITNNNSATVAEHPRIYQ